MPVMDGGTVRRRTSEGLIKLGLRYAHEDGVDLQPDQTVPMGWLTANHETGRSEIAATATIPANPAVTDRA